MSEGKADIASNVVALDTHVSSDDLRAGSVEELVHVPNTGSLAFDKIKLAGFKSFVDPTDFFIQRGLTGIVGPNGCGKSNLLEAIRWVMGANSAKAMRAKGMDDVIFSGTQTRPGRSSAQVTLSIDNSARIAPAQFNDDDELEVTRLIRKGGGSTYKVNGRKVRAKDVQLLFADSSTGANSPALVRQGQINELIASKPQNRRRILEEAAGISGLHTRRHEAELRLRAAENNLERLDDVIGAIEGQLHTLRRQSRQAARYKRLAGEIHEYKALLWHKRWHGALAALEAADRENRSAQGRVARTAQAAAELTRKAAELDGLLEPRREEQLVAAAVLARLNAARETLERDERVARAEISGLEAATEQLASDLARETGMVEDAQAARARLSEEFERLAGVADTAEALAAAERDATEAVRVRAELDEAFTELTRLAADRLARLDGAERRRDQADKRIARLERDMERSSSKLQGLGRGPSADTANLFESAASNALMALQDARAQEQRLRAEWEATEQHVESARAELARARSALGELHAEAKALRMMVTQGGNSDHKPALDFIEVDAGFELALAAALGEGLDAAVGQKAPTAWMGAELGTPGFYAGRSLASVTRAPAELQACLRHIVVVDDGDFDAVRDKLESGQTVVTRAGRLARWDGFTVAESAQTAAALKLQNQNRLGELQGEIRGAQDNVDYLEVRHSNAREVRERADEATKAARRILPDLEATERQSQGALARYEADVAREASDRANLEDSIARIRRDLQEAGEQRAQAEADITAVGEVQGLRTEQDELAAKLLDAREAADEASARFRTLRSESDARTARKAAIARERDDWRGRGDKAADRVASLQTRLVATRDRLSEATSGPDPFAERRTRLFAELEAAESRRTAAADSLSAAEREARDTDRAAREAETEHSNAREARAGSEARHTAAQERVAEVRARIAETLSCEPDGLSSRLGALSPDNPMGEHDVERRIEKLSAERERLGNVNLRADEEAEEQETQLAQMTTERDDLTQAIAKLREGIDELNSEGRQRLLAAFDIVNAHFSRLFTSLFQGGEASLALTESDDPLEAGLEIMAAPPGKQIGSMSLLSGGEQALTATALIFAVFLSNPAPICVLDEVDAPLDDANVARYCDMLDEMARSTRTRFIAITHNPVTMSRMDRLFGVTMAERGVSQLLSVQLSEATELAAAE